MAGSLERGISDPILIVGTGAMATLFAARLRATGREICMLGSWENGLQALRENGARLIEADGSQSAYPVQVADDPTQCKGTRLALVLVKAWQTEQAAEKLDRCLAPDGVALTLQNGVGNRETLTHMLGASRVAIGVSTSGATLLGPGLARTGGEGGISLEAHARLDPLQTALSEAGFKVQVVKDAEALIWGKLIINAAINPLTALLRIPNGDLLKRPAAHNLMRLLAQEAAIVASAQGIRLPFEDAVKAAEDVARRTSGNHSSMYQDIRRGAQTEIDAICGAITQTGDKLGIATPVNRVCWQLMSASVSTLPLT